MRSCRVLVLRRCVLCIPVDVAVSKHLDILHVMAEFAQLYTCLFSGDGEVQVLVLVVVYVQIPCAIYVSLLKPQDVKCMYP